MKYYAHHLGDYLRDTMHLSMIEDGAYRRLLDAYYNREAPIPKSLPIVYRLVRAETKTERLAVQAVLKQFFRSTSDGWHHERCDEEIAGARKRIETARNNGKLGGRPRNQEETKPVISGFDSAKPIENYPLSTLHSPILRKESEGQKGPWRNVADVSRHTAKQLARIRETKS